MIAIHTYDYLIGCSCLSFATHADAAKRYDFSVTTKLYGRERLCYDRHTRKICGKQYELKQNHFQKSKVFRISTNRAKIRKQGWGRFWEKGDKLST